VGVLIRGSQFPERISGKGKEGNRQQKRPPANSKNPEGSHPHPTPSKRS